MDFSGLKNDYFYKGEEVILRIDNSGNSLKKMLLLSFPDELYSKLSEMKAGLNDSLNPTDEIDIEITKSCDDGKFDISVYSRALPSALEAFNIKIDNSVLNDLLKINMTKEEVQFGFHVYRNPQGNSAHSIIDYSAFLHTEQDEETGGFKDEGGR